LYVHVKPDQRKTWDPHGLDGWYTGHTTEHYRSYQVHMQDTNAERITDTLSWFPRNVTLPTATSTELIVAALQDVTHELQNQRPENSIINISDTNTEILKSITNTLTNVVHDTSEDYTTDWGNLKDTATDVAIPVDKNEPAAVPRVFDTNRNTTHASQRVPTIAPTNIEDDFQVAMTLADEELKQCRQEECMQPQRVAATNITAQVKFAPCPPAFTPSYRHPNNGNKSPIDTAHANNLDRWPEPRKIEQHRNQHNTRNSAKVAYIDKIHFACYGNAINPDTGLPAEYPELIKSSDGEHWIAAGSEEIGRLTEGNGSTMQTGTGTMEFMYLH
jgi:hypothetical protein